MTKRAGLVLLTTLFGLSAGCTVVGCPPSSLGKELLVTTVHAEASDAPLMWGQAIYEDGILRLDRAGRRAHCRRVKPAELDQLRRLVGEGEILVAYPPIEGGPHDERIQVAVGERVQIYYEPRIPEEVRDLLEEIDTLFSGAFGDRYSWRLSGEKGGP